MTRRTLLSMLVALIAIVFANIGTTSVASAQCCRFVVDVDCNLSPNCLPIRVTTTWVGGGAVGTQLDLATTSGCNTNVFPITALPCPPAPALRSYSLNGGPVIAAGGPPVRVALIPGACCVWTWASISPVTGCVVIYVVPC